MRLVSIALGGADGQRIGRAGRAARARTRAQVRFLARLVSAFEQVAVPGLPPLPSVDQQVPWANSATFLPW